MDGRNILTLSGWTQPADALLSLAPNAEVVDYSEARSPKDVSELLAHQHYDLIIGWSLGGIIARILLHEGHISADALVLLSTPYQFVRDAHFDAAMPQDTFDLFYTNYQKDTQRTMTRFAGLLAMNDKYQDRIKQMMDHHELGHQPELWLPWLDFLHHYSSRDTQYQLPPCLIIHGEEDAIVMVDQTKPLAKATNAELIIYPECGHAPHLHDGDKLRNHIADFTSRVWHG